MEWAPLGEIQPAKLAKNRLKVISDQSVSFVAGPWPGWLHKNLRITLNSLLYSNSYRGNHTEPVPVQRILRETTPDLVFAMLQKYQDTEQRSGDSELEAVAVAPAADRLRGRARTGASAGTASHPRVLERSGSRHARLAGTAGGITHAGPGSLRVSCGDGDVMPAFDHGSSRLETCGECLPIE